ncbi:MAG TPA: 23S rRNA (uracil(1939)-C(5))-methyltransferase RlmD [Candidatus Binataceae bacterium]|nr:23S rRNA (uracil(1939)-C(5))-methyltransferase RlmD [Candidatus Binataceae bacterium]
MAEIEITAMTLGPYGLGHRDGKTVMVPGAAPGDRLEVAIRAERRDYSLGALERIIAPGPARRPPPCPYLPRCGGCDWQQIAYPAQVRLKAELIARELGRALGVEIDPAGLVEPAPAEFGYRARIRLQVGRGGALGFYELGSNQLVAIEECLLAEAGLAMPSTLARMLARDLSEIETVAAGNNRSVLVGYVKKPAGPQQLERASRVLEADPRIAGIVLRAGERRETLGEVEIEIEVEPGVTLRGGADLFSQVNRAQNLRLIAEVMAMAAPAPGVKLLDLFCGTGNFSIPAARRGARVTGVDADAPAVAAAQRNARRMQLSDAQFVAMQAHELAAFLKRARFRPDAVILDPPRTGAADLVEPISKLAPARVVYVSCDAATLARDLRAFGTRGYKLSRVRAFDFFPNTHHAEIAAQTVLT